MMTSQHEIIKIVASQLEDKKGHLTAADSIAGETRLIKDLGFSSVEFIVIFEKIQQTRRERINFIDLIMPDRSTYVDDLTIDQIACFLSQEEQYRKPASSGSDPYVNRREQIIESDIEKLNSAIKHQVYAREEVVTNTQICFLLSAPRSGSTLVRRMLNCHPEIYAPMELHLMCYQDFGQRDKELSDNDHSHLLEGTIVARQEIRDMPRSVSQAIDKMYARDRRTVTKFYTEIDPYIQTKILIDKTPTYAFSRATLDRIKNTFPQAKFIHLVRRPNAVIKSIIDSEIGQLIRFVKTSNIEPNRFPEALWCLCERNILSAMKDEGSRILRIEYESIVESPVSAMNMIHRFLEIRPSQEINPYLQSEGQSEEKVGSYAGDLKNFLRNFIDPSVANEWKSFNSLNWLSEPTLSLLQNEQSLAENQANLC